MNYDLINASFEAFAAIVLILNIKAIIKDKCVMGVSFAPAIVFCVWGFWNIFYYSHLDQIASSVAAAFVAVANLIWLLLALNYRAEKNGG